MIMNISCLRNISVGSYYFDVYLRNGKILFEKVNVIIDSLNMAYLCKENY